MRVALRFAYDARFPNGYARQPEGGTVEDALIAAAKHEGYVAKSWTTGSRTDKGVAAAENVAALELERPHLEGLVPALQARVPPGLWVMGAAEVDTDWNPRHHATRNYLYVATEGGEDLQRMQTACSAFVGTHNMSAFARVEPPRNPMRTIDSCTVERGHGLLRFNVASEGFLWNQVRRMVDAVLCVGRGDANVDDVMESLQTGVPHSKFDLAPADGLLLKSVNYDPAIDWDARAGSLDGRRLAGPRQRNVVEAALLRALTESS